jgi:hypothetical protein
MEWQAETHLSLMVEVRGEGLICFDKFPLFFILLNNINQSQELI